MKYKKATTEGQTLIKNEETRLKVKPKPMIQ